MAQQVLLTKSGYDKLKTELEELKGPTRRRIAEAIKEAKSHGDLRENAAYHEAKLNQERLESRIADLEKVLEVARIVERPDGAEAVAHLGSKVLLIDHEFGDEFEVTLVGSYESDPSQDLISITSPLGGALLSKQVGDKAEVEAPGGLHVYTIKGIR